MEHDIQMSHDNVSGHATHHTRRQRRSDKSKLGCLACKQRKVKCDEAHPLCGNCSKRYPGLTECGWPKVDYPSENLKREKKSDHARAQLLVKPKTDNSSRSKNGPFSAPVTPAHSGENDDSRVSITADTPSSSTHPIRTASPLINLDNHPLRSQFLQPRLLELRLFHQWSTSTLQTIQVIQEGNPIANWLEQTCAWSFSYDFILDFTLAFGALHLFCIDPLGNSCLQPIILSYMASANRLHREALAEVTSSNARPLFVAAVCTNLFHKAKTKLRHPNEPYQLPVDMFSYHRGIVATYKACLPFIPEEEMLAIRFVSSNRQHIVFEEGVDLDGDLSYLTEDQRKDTQILLGYITSEAEAGHLDQAKQSALRSALSSILSVQFGQRAHEPIHWTRRRINLMPSLVPPEFGTLLEERNFLAMAILARFFMLLKDAKEWYHEGMADVQVHGIASLMPEKWQFLMEYPLLAIGQDPKGRKWSIT